MGTRETTHQADAAEQLAAIFDDLLDTLGLLALQPGIQRRPDLLADLTRGAEGLITARAVVFAWRAAITAAAHAPSPDSDPPGPGS